jgi:hypothetical protein
MKRRARYLLFSVSLALYLLPGLEVRLASGQETTADWPATSQNVSQGQQQGSAQPDRSISLRKLPANILQDQKAIFFFPKELAKGKHWWPTIGVVGVTAGLMASDPYSAPPFRTTNGT